MDKIIETSLKEKSTNRLLYDMIQEVKESVGQNNLIMMIVDPYTMRILSTFLTISELLARGIISIENLEIGRKKFPKYHCIYFISPTQKAIDFLKKDFADADSPQYSRMHLFFCHKISDSLLDDLICTSHLAKRIKSCKELNISYFLRDRNLFDIGMPDAIEIYTQINEKTRELSRSGEQLLFKIAERLYTACVTVKEYPFIQYQKNSLLGSRLAKMVNGMLKEFYSSKVFNEKRGILLILDRFIDSTTPFLHDYSYETIVRDFYSVKDNVLTFKGTNKLDDKDEIWMKYRNKHIGQVLNGLQDDFKEFMSSDFTKKQRDQTNMDSFEKMSELLHGRKEFKEKSRQFKVHLSLAGDIMEVNILTKI